jgi:hypothetical protein
MIPFPSEIPRDLYVFPPQSVFLTQMEACLRSLVVDHVLPNDGQANPFDPASGGELVATLGSGWWESWLPPEKLARIE